MKTFIARLYKTELDKLTDIILSKKMTNAQLVEFCFNNFIKLNKKKQTEYSRYLEFDRLKTYPFQVKFNEEFVDKFDYTAEILNVKRGQLLRMILMSVIEPK